MREELYRSWMGECERVWKAVRRERSMVCTAESEWERSICASGLKGAKAQEEDRMGGEWGDQWNQRPTTSNQERGGWGEHGHGDVNHVTWIM
jgi:hypothetical protein